MDVQALVEEEAARNDGSLAVVVSGPPGMADEVQLDVMTTGSNQRDCLFLLLYGNIAVATTI
jgi:hypothetical protein